MGRRGRMTTTMAGKREGSLDDGYNCVVREDGVLVAEDVPSGTYEVSAWWSGTRIDGEGTVVATARDNAGARCGANSRETVNSCARESRVGRTR